MLEVLATFGEAFLLGKKNILRSLVAILTYKEAFEDMWSIGEDFLFLYGSLGNLCWLYPRKGFHQLHKDYLLHNSWGDCHCVLDPLDSPLIVLYFTRDFFFFWKFELTRVCSWCFRSTMDACVVFVSFTQLRVFWSFWHVLEFFFCTSYLQGTHWGFWGIFFAKLHVV